MKGDHFVSGAEVTVPLVLVYAQVNGSLMVRVDCDRLE